VGDGTVELYTHAFAADFFAAARDSLIMKKKHDGKVDGVARTAIFELQHLWIAPNVSAQKLPAWREIGWPQIPQNVYSASQE